MENRSIEELVGLTARSMLGWMGETLKPSDSVAAVIGEVWGSTDPMLRVLEARFPDSDGEQVSRLLPEGIAVTRKVRDIELRVLVGYLGDGQQSWEVLRGGAVFVSSLNGGEREFTPIGNAALWWSETSPMSPIRGWSGGRVASPEGHASFVPVLSAFGKEGPMGIFAN
jgi:hypothetical protein